MTREPHKRPAGEVIAALQEPETSPVPGTSASRRPIGIILGTIFILLRATSGVLWMLEAAGSWDELDHEVFPETTGGFYTLIGFYGSWTIALLVLAWLLWRGSDAVRLTVLLWTTVTIIFIAVGYYAHGERITIHTTLVTLALDILVLLALSGQDARTWTRERRNIRRAEKGKAQK